MSAFPTMEYYKRFRHCPCCGAVFGADAFDGEHTVFVCSNCRYEFYQNPAPSVTAVIPEAPGSERVLLITRSNDPAAGRLALPGGFVGYREDPGAAVVREVREETLLTIHPERVLMVHPVDYHYQGSRIPIVEVSYLTKPVHADVSAHRTPEAQGMAFYEIGAVLEEAQRLAFPEHAKVLRAYSALARV